MHLGPMREYKTAMLCEQGEAEGCRLALNAPGASPGFRAQYLKQVQDLAQISCADYAALLLRQVTAPRPECLPLGELPPQAPCRTNLQCMTGRCEGKEDSAGSACRCPVWVSRVVLTARCRTFARTRCALRPRQPGQPCEQGEVRAGLVLRVGRALRPYLEVKTPFASLTTSAPRPSIVSTPAANASRPSPSAAPASPTGRSDATSCWANTATARRACRRLSRNWASRVTPRTNVMQAWDAKRVGRP